MSVTKSTDVYHWEFGRHSNIPDCCIGFWIKSVKNLRNHFRYTRLVFKKDPFDRWGYIPCPNCFKARKVVKVHFCKGGCDEPYKKIRYA